MLRRSLKKKTVSISMSIDFFLALLVDMVIIEPTVEFWRNSVAQCRDVARIINLRGRVSVALSLILYK